MLTVHPVKRVVAVCNSCERESEPVDFVAPIVPMTIPGEFEFDRAEQAFAKIHWILTPTGAWCPECKGLPR
jgi:hypothetical protein